MLLLARHDGTKERVLEREEEIGVAENQGRIRDTVAPET